MEYLVIDCGRTPLALSLEIDPPWIFQDGLSPWNLQRLASVFFEWIFGTHGEVCGVELCDISDEDESYALLVKAASPLIDLAFRPRIWFTDQREGEIRHYQDWEGHIFRRSAPEAAVIALSTHWLSSQERSTLQPHINQQNLGKRGKSDS
jgi:hypothetical protein